MSTPTGMPWKSSARSSKSQGPSNARHPPHGDPSSRSGRDGNCNMAPESDPPMDPFLMDFGASVSVHEDQIRRVRAGTQDIEERISKTNADLKKEDMVNRLLKDDLRHCETEKKDILQRTGDQLETVQMQSNFLQGLETTLCANLVPAVVSPDRRSSGQNKAVSYRNDIIPNRQESFKQLSRQIKDDTREIEDLQAQIKAYQEKLRAKQERLDAENLEEALAEKTKEADRIEAEVESEMKKSQATKAAILKKRKEAGANAQELTDLTKRRDDFRRELEQKKDNILETIEKAKKSEKENRDKHNDLKTQLTNVQTQIQALQKTERVKEALKEAIANLESKEKQHEELTRIKDDVATKLEASTTDLKAHELKLEEAKKLEAAANRAKATNDYDYNNILVPGRVELSEIAEKKEQLAKRIAETQKTFSELEVSGKEQLDSKLEAKRSLLVELAHLQEQFDSRKNKREVMEHSNQESKESWEREINELEALEQKLRNTTATKEAYIKELKANQDKRRRENLEEAKTLAENETAKSNRLLQLLGGAQKYIEKAKGKVELLGESLDI